LASPLWDEALPSGPCEPCEEMGARRRTLRAAGAVGLVAVLAFAATGCGGSSSSTTTNAGSELETWADGLCKAAGKYKTSMAAARASLHVRQLSRPAIQVALQDANAARRELANDLDELGPSPAPQSVAAAKKVLDDLQNGVKKQANKVRDIATNASSTGDVRQAASNITDALTAGTDGVSHAVDELRKLEPRAEVEPAFDNAESCSAL
jgi:hypothetical protein